MMGVTDTSMSLMPLESDTDPRPLHLIPYDPGVDQSTKESVYARRTFHERWHAAILGFIGRAITPTTVTLGFDLLLMEVTLGMYELWQSQDTRRNLRQVCRKFGGRLFQRLPRELAGHVQYERGIGWRIEMESDETQEGLIGHLAHVRAEQLDLPREPEPYLPEVFDEE